MRRCANCEGAASHSRDTHIERRYEVVICLVHVQRMHIGSCSSEATENGHMIMGQNWDWIRAADCCIVLRVEQPNRPSLDLR